MSLDWKDAAACTDCGWLKGYVQEELRVFKGIPYAAPPVGELRWRPPQPAHRWSGLRMATQFGGEPVQGERDEPDLSRAHRSEDCLYLNIYSPATDADDRLPVFVWIHGGGYTGGASSQNLYFGEALARKGIVVVTINYRLGLFGFFCHPELIAESEHGACGNYGLMDQTEALRWVKRNIAGFGGDPDAVTIAGQSAGAGSVGAQLTSPHAEGLFRSACVQSGPIYWHKMPAAEEAAKTGEAMAHEIGAPSLAGLRALPALDLFDKYKKSGVRFPPVADGWFLPKAMM